jgi:hypothetical protein
LLGIHWAAPRRSSICLGLNAGFMSRLENVKLVSTSCMRLSKCRGVTLYCRQAAPR